MSTSQVPPVSARTRNEEVYFRLRADILAGRFRPSQKLAFAELCERYGVSVGVIREALTRVAEQELVHNAPQQGFYVSTISPSDLQELSQARCDIESLTLRYAIREGDVAWESEVLAAHHRLANTPLVTVEDPERLSEEWAKNHSIFHETLLRGCSNARLRGIATQLRASAELYRRWSVPLGHERNRDIAGEHKAIADAVLRRDADLAVKLLVDHISTTTNLLLDSGLAHSRTSEK